MPLKPFKRKLKDLAYIKILRKTIKTRGNLIKDGKKRGKKRTSSQKVLR